MFFDLSRPETFHDTPKEKVNANWLINEANTMNKNNKITMYLIGTNPDKATSFNREDALKMAENYNMNYHELNVNNT